ncbi:hypothetical protein TNCV_3838501 [Trichonephila clavipes]|nr:hypothetical protein TNCV_3838501 [Trichonephila clavipes]
MGVSQHVMSSSLVPLRIYRLERLRHVKSVGLKRPPVDEVWKLEEVDPAYMSSSSLDHGSKLQGPSLQKPSCS